MLDPTVTELTRGTAHPESQLTQAVLVAVSPVALRPAPDASAPAQWPDQQAA
jgi:hypothetical protein